MCKQSDSKGETKVSLDSLTRAEVRIIVNHMVNVCRCVNNVM
jgi:hypothetical protein